MTLVFFLTSGGADCVVATGSAAAAAAAAVALASDAGAVVEIDRSDDARGTRQQCGGIGKRFQAWSSGRALPEREPVRDIHRAITGEGITAGFNALSETLWLFCERHRTHRHSSLTARQVISNVLREFRKQFSACLSRSWGLTTHSADVPVAASRECPRRLQFTAVEIAKYTSTVVLEADWSLLLLAYTSQAQAAPFAALVF